MRPGMLFSRHESEVSISVDSNYEDWQHYQKVMKNSRSKNATWIDAEMPGKIKTETKSSDQDCLYKRLLLKLLM